MELEAKQGQSRSRLGHRWPRKGGVGINIFYMEIYKLTSDKRNLTTVKRTDMHNLFCYFFPAKPPSAPMTGIVQLI